MLEEKHLVLLLCPGIQAYLHMIPGSLILQALLCPFFLFCTAALSMWPQRWGYNKEALGGLDFLLIFSYLVTLGDFFFFFKPKILKSIMLEHNLLDGIYAQFTQLHWLKPKTWVYVGKGNS